MGQEDGPADGSQLWVYVGTKQQSGPPVAKAGLTNGDDHVLDAVDQAVIDRHPVARDVRQGRRRAGRPRRQRLEPDRRRPERRRAKADGLSLNRIEDGHWDPNHPNDFYFLTTEGGDTAGNRPRPAATAAACGGSAWPTSRIPMPAPR